LTREVDHMGDESLLPS